MLHSEGYRETDMEYTSEDHTAWRDDSGRTVDLHLFEFSDSETVSFLGEPYPAHILGGEGIIGGLTVRCLTAEAQLQYHQGYEHDEKDRHDVLLLCETFGFPIPAEYAE
jgi:lincosamide nucleotidyltransferase A/C/D/E